MSGVLPNRLRSCVHGRPARRTFPQDRSRLHAYASTMGPDALDFWLGTWEGTWGGGGGTNTITRELGEAVVVERFEAAAPEPWSGMSVSVHDPAADRWRQTWVDSNGSYWHFVGMRTVEGTIFATPEPVDQDQTFKRMVFSDVTP